MPISYGVRRAANPEDLLPWDFVESRLVSARNYWVVTTGALLRPHAVPVWGLWQEGSFFFSTDPDSRKARDLVTNSRVVVHLESGDECVILEGRAAPIIDQGDRQRLSAAYEAKYGIRIGDGLLLGVRPSRVLAWRESDFPDSATRWLMQPRPRKACQIWDRSEVDDAAAESDA
jgi:general stress protein 26